jgi:hypothetical protein
VNESLRKIKIIIIIINKGRREKKQMTLLCIIGIMSLGRINLYNSSIPVIIIIIAVGMTQRDVYILYNIKACRNTKHTIRTYHRRQVRLVATRIHDEN